MPAIMPHEPEAARASEPIPQRPRVERSTRILLVEDEPLTAEVFARALLREGFQVEIAVDGLQALNHLRDRLPSLVVLDMSLPTLSGTEIVRRLRSAGHRDVPVVVVSGSPRSDSDLSAAELWPGTWVEKPVKPRSLVSIVREFTRDQD